MAQERLVYTVVEVGRLLGLSAAGAYQAVVRGDIPSLRIGRRLLIPKVAVDRILAEAAQDESGRQEAYIKSRI